MRLDAVAEHRDTVDRLDERQVTCPGDVGVLLAQGEPVDLAGGEPEHIGVRPQILPGDVLRGGATGRRQVPVEPGDLACGPGGRVQFEHTLRPELLAQLPYA
ncbi:hypothetical protein [Streptomyces sp. NRRL WC-3618]|uniref:hypothetical protein n=1 Tax=Streptomyces sp. NRRL WC-3618 TaxID=1519490 RepID=UPI001F40DAD2|nr:hypothetical protein [Streptomyces sp. NRRL WC-3618]